MARSIVEPRNLRSERTRAELLAAMRSLLEEQGFQALSMAAVAERAGVSRRAVYLHFNSRTDLVTALFDYVSREERLAESLRAVWDAPSGVDALDEWARHLARYTPRVLAVDNAVELVRDQDDDARKHHRTVVRQQRANARRLIRWLHEDGVLAPGWTVDTATEMFWALMSPDVVRRLVVDLHWSRRQLAEHLIRTFRAVFVTPNGRE
ncbi:MAG TPA: helix-turn-helix domain-containing protein [Pseudonocardiaceae bacterium]|nr:helix-turn-helix domain-containing protein [Pseudonocardiaceae bacterium]